MCFEFGVPSGLNSLDDGKHSSYTQKNESQPLDQLIFFCNRYIIERIDLVSRIKYHQPKWPNQDGQDLENTSLVGLS